MTMPAHVQEPAFDDRAVLASAPLKEKAQRRLGTTWRKTARITLVSISLICSPQ